MNDFLPAGSICSDCEYCMLRFIRDLQGDEWIVEEGEEVDGYVDALCLINGNSLMDHVVTHCNKFDGQDAPNPFLHNKFL